MRVNIAVHLQNWASARYIVAACNAAGCTDSAEIFPKNLMLDTIGYFKASNTDPEDYFGRDVALSNDGRTFAVSAEQEASDSDRRQWRSGGQQRVWIGRRLYLPARGRGLEAGSVSQGAKGPGHPIWYRRTAFDL